MIEQRLFALCCVGLGVAFAVLAAHGHSTTAVFNWVFAGCWVLIGAASLRPYRRQK